MTIRLEDQSPGGLSDGTPFSGRVLQFDGIAEEVTVANSIGNVQSLSFYINPLTLTEEILDLNGTETITLVAGTITLNGTWTGSIIYVDGVVSSTLTSAFHRVTITVTVAIVGSILKLAHVGAGFGNIELSDVVFWSQVLTSAEALFDYQNPEKLASDSPGSSLDPSTDLIAHYPLTDGFSNTNYNFVLDISGNENHGINDSAGAAWLNQQDDIISQLSLDNYSNYSLFVVDDCKVSIDLSNLTTGPYTFCFWILVPAYGLPRYLFDGRATADGYIAINSVTPIILVPSGTIYIDDALNSTLTLKKLSLVTVSGMTLTSPDANMLLFAFNSDITNSFRGLTFEASIFSGTFDAADVTEMYNSGSPIDALTHSKSANLVGYWRNSINSIWPDLSGFSANGILSGPLEKTVVVKGNIAGKDGFGFPLTNPRTPTDVMNFDDTSYIDVGQDVSIQPANAITLAAWIKPFALPAADAGVLLTPSQVFQSGMQLTYDLTGKVQFLIATALNTFVKITFDDVLVFGTWVFVLATWDTTDDAIAGYVNDVVQVGTGIAANSFFGTVDTDGKIGQISTSEFPGSIGDSFIYNVRLSTLDRTSLFNVTKGKYGVT